MCMSTMPAPASAATRAISGSPSAVTSFTIDAPASSARRATMALVVSTEMQAPSAASASSTGSSRLSCSSTGTGAAPGRVLSAPRSTTSAPSAISDRPCAIAAPGSRYRPPSENESGVTFTMPMTSVRSPRSNSRSRHRQSIGPPTS